MHQLVSLHLTNDVDQIWSLESYDIINMSFPKWLKGKKKVIKTISYFYGI